MRKLLYILALWSVFISAVMAATKVDTTYEIKKAWADKESFYVMYDKVLTKVHFSMLDINGTVLNEKKNLYLKRFNKAGISKNTINLENDGEYLNGTGMGLTENDYIDQDISIKENNGMAIVSANGKQIQFRCDHKMWKPSFPVNFGDKLFYCGNIYSIASGIIEALPQNVQSKIEAIRIKNPTGGYYWLDYTSDGRNLLIRSCNVFPPVRDASKDTYVTLKLQIDDLKAEEVILSLLANDNLMIMNNSFAYSTKGFVLGGRLKYAPSELLLVTTEESKQIVSGRAAYRYLVVDNFANVTYFIYQELFTSPEIRITTVKR